MDEDFFFIKFSSKILFTSSLILFFVSLTANFQANRFSFASISLIFSPFPHRGNFLFSLQCSYLENWSFLWDFFCWISFIAFHFAIEGAIFWFASNEWEYGEKKRQFLVKKCLYFGSKKLQKKHVVQNEFFWLNVSIDVMESQAINLWISSPPSLFAHLAHQIENHQIAVG